MKVSIVDTSPIRLGSTATEAFQTTMELAAVADQADRLRSYELIAEACFPRRSVKVGNT